LFTNFFFCLLNSSFLNLLYDEFSEQSIHICEFSEHLCYAQITEALFVFYDIYVNLCKSKKVSPSKAAEQVGLNRTSVVKWKGGTVPSGDTLNKFAQYFGVSIDYLLGNKQKETPTLTKKDEREITFDDFTYALHGEAKELTDENKQKLLEMARLFKMSQDQEKNKK